MNRTDEDRSAVFAFFNEIGIINQLSTTMLAHSLPDGVHPSHFAIMNHLVRRGDGQPPARIAAAMQVSKNTMTHSLKVLQERNFITVAPDPSDGRGKLVNVTVAGRSFLIKAIANAQATFGPVIGPQQAEIMERILGDLQALRKHLDDNRPA